MSPTGPEFDAAARSLFRGNCEELLKLKPFLTIVSNQCDRTLVAYALVWNLAQWGTGVMFDQRKYPDAVSPASPRRGNEIRPGERKITAMGIEIHGGLWGEQATEDFYLASSPAGLENSMRRLGSRSALTRQSSKTARSWARTSRNSTRLSWLTWTRSRSTTEQS